MLTHATFLSQWYWVFAALFWGLVCNYTFGVPNELLLRARRSREDAALFHRFARRNLRLFARRIVARAPFAAAGGAFLLALLGTYAARTGSEGALGLFIILLPAALLSAWGAREIVRAAEAGRDREALWRLFQRARIGAAAAAAFSILSAASAASLRHGPGWTEALLRGF